MLVPQKVAFPIPCITSFNVSFASSGGTIRAVLFKSVTLIVWYMHASAKGKCQFGERCVTSCTRLVELVLTPKIRVIEGRLTTPLAFRYVIAVVVG